MMQNIQNTKIKTEAYVVHRAD